MENNRYDMIIIGAGPAGIFAALQYTRKKADAKVLIIASIDGTTLSAVLQQAHDKGVKIIAYHGVADAIFSAEDTRQWFLRLDRAAAKESSCPDT